MEIIIIYLNNNNNNTNTTIDDNANRTLQKFINHYRGYLLSFLFDVFLLLVWNFSSHEEFLCCNYFEINSTPNWRSKSEHDVRISSPHLFSPPGDWFRNRHTIQTKLIRIFLWAFLQDILGKGFLSSWVG